MEKIIELGKEMMERRKEGNEKKWEENPYKKGNISQKYEKGGWGKC